MKKIIILFIGLLFLFSCASFIEDNLDNALGISIIIKVEGDNKKLINIGYYIKNRKNKWDDNPADSAMKVAKIENLPFLYRVTGTSDDILYIYCKPIDISKDITLKLYSWGKEIQSSIITPNNPGMYTTYCFR